MHNNLKQIEIMKVYLLTEIGTNIIFDTIFSTKDLAEAEIAKRITPEYWEIIELKFK